MQVMFRVMVKGKEWLCSGVLWSRAASLKVEHIQTRPRPRFDLSGHVMEAFAQASERTPRLTI